jgi:hypothetical protein
LAHTIERCLAKAPEDRFASGEELAAALGSALPALVTTPAPVARAARELHELGTDMGGYGSVLLLVVASFLSLPLFRAAGLTDAFLGLMRIGVGLGMISLAGMRKVTAFRAIRDAIRRGYGYEDIRAALLGQDEEREPVTIGAKAVAIGGWLAAFGTSVVAWAFVGSVGNQWHGLVQIAADLAVIFIPLSAGRWAAARLTAPTLKGPSWWDRW